MEQFKIFFKEQKKRLRQVKDEQSKYLKEQEILLREMPDIVVQNPLINDFYMEEEELSNVYTKRQNTKRMFSRLIDNLFQSISIIFLKYKEMKLDNDTDEEIKLKTKKEIVDYSLVTFRANPTNPSNDPFREFFFKMYDTIVTTSTESFSPILAELVKSSKNKTFQDIVKNHENTFRILGVDVEDCQAKRKVRKEKTTKPTTPEKKIKTSNNNNSCSINQFLNTSTPTTLNKILSDNKCAINLDTSIMIPVETPNKSFAMNSQTSVKFTDPDMTVVLGHNNDADIKKDFIIDNSTDNLKKQIENLKTLLQEERNKRVKEIDSSTDFKEQIQNLKNQLYTERKRAEEERKRVVDNIENEYKERKYREEKRIEDSEDKKKMQERIKLLEQQNEELKKQLKEQENTFNGTTYI